jgi:hypothetical protein
MEARIATQLDREAVFSSLGELTTEGGLLDVGARLKGQLRPPALSVAYQTSLMIVPRLRIAAFVGRVVSAQAGVIIEGTVEASVIAWLVGASLIFVVVFSAVRALVERDYLELLSVFVIGAAMLWAWAAYVQSTKRFIVKELCRASRGSVV